MNNSIICSFINTANSQNCDIEIPLDITCDEFVKGDFIGFKDIRDPKTYFDPEIITNEQMLVWAKEAMQNGVQNGRIIDGIASNGLKFRGFIQEDGNIRYFPHF